MKDRLFVQCLCLSAAAHTLIFIAVPHRILTYTASQRPIEVAYVQSFGAEKETRETSPEPPPQERRHQTAVPRKNAFEERTTFLQDFLKAEIFRPENKKEVPDQRLNTPSQSPKKKSVQTPNIPGEIFQSQEYKDYYQVVREKIRRQAYRNYKRIQEGEVLLTFTLSRAGDLQDVRIDEAKSLDDEYLRAIALESVRQSSPFPGFPPKLRDKEQLAFNVIISFELK
ncbi:MAG: TonB family protein [Candidatus Omnitrophica bacterium]|nr:TonB family protein [Candidatus Omnitrophota bacterium]MDD5574024.1 TonB family protein [Candidatus Omnitrophota bacterium]